ncbi:MAG: hypothetical protein GX868_18150 [Actinobacteria bacterium]|nr:hypothetical protein [Actinomycetota bacterium]
MPPPSNPFASGGESFGPASGGSAGIGDPAFGAGGTIEVTKPPVALLAVASVLAVVGIALGALSIVWNSWLGIVGWVFAGPIAIGVLAFFVVKDTAKRALPAYLRPDGVGALYAGVAFIVVVGIGVSASGFALWVGHR